MHKSVYNPLADTAIFILSWASLSFHPGTLKRTAIDILTEKLRQPNFVLGPDLSGNAVVNLKKISEQSVKLNSIRHLTPTLDIETIAELEETHQAYCLFCHNGLISFDEILWILNSHYSNPDLNKGIQKLSRDIDLQLDIYQKTNGLSLAA
jgi:hypothetical protein